MLDTRFLDTKERGIGSIHIPQFGVRGSSTEFSKSNTRPEAGPFSIARLSVSASGASSLLCSLSDRTVGSRLTRVFASLCTCCPMLILRPSFVN